MDKPLKVAVPPTSGWPSTHTRPAGSLVVALTVTVPAVCAVVVMPYRVVAALNAGYIATPVPATEIIRVGATAAAADVTADVTPTVPTDTSDTRNNAATDNPAI